MPINVSVAGHAKTFVRATRLRLNKVCGAGELGETKTKDVLIKCSYRDANDYIVRAKQNVFDSRCDAVR